MPASSGCILPNDGVLSQEGEEEEEEEEEEGLLTVRKREDSEKCRVLHIHCTQCAREEACVLLSEGHSFLLAVT